MEHLSSAPAAASQRLFHLNHAAIVPYFAGTAIKLAKAAAAAPVQDAIRTKTGSDISLEVSEPDFSAA
jgi:hypothetical protein